MKVKTTELTGANLAYFVAIADGQNPRVPAWAEEPRVYLLGGIGMRPERYRPHEDWSQGGPIKEREGIATRKSGGAWFAMRSSDLGNGERAQWGEYSWIGVPADSKPRRVRFRGDTELTAAMRCFVASRLGDEVDIPKGLMTALNAIQPLTQLSDDIDESIRDRRPAQDRPDIDEEAT